MQITGKMFILFDFFLEFIQFDEETEEPIMTIDEVTDQLREQKFRWNNSEEIWEYFGKDHRADYGSLGHKRGDD